MEEAILISYLNDFIFCPISIYFHKMYGKLDNVIYQTTDQLEGSSAHKAIDTKTYSSRKNILQVVEVFSSKYNIQGKIDIFDIEEGKLVERKNKVEKIYDGYVFQMYAQYYALTEMGYFIKSLQIYSMIDNKKYEICLPEDDKIMKKKFEDIVQEIRIFDVENFKQENFLKCKKCIYEPICDRSYYVE